MYTRLWDDAMILVWHPVNAIVDALLGSIGARGDGLGREGLICLHSLRLNPPRGVQ